jgi:hypothetical protein
LIIKINLEKSIGTILERERDISDFNDFCVGIKRQTTPLSNFNFGDMKLSSIRPRGHAGDPFE